MIAEKVKEVGPLQTERTEGVPLKRVRAVLGTRGTQWDTKSRANRRAAALAAAFKAIGHPVRLQILDILSRQPGQVCVCDIESQFDLSQPTISHHLRVLRKAGLVDSEQRGRWSYYFVCEEGLAPLRAFLTAISRF